MAALRPSSGHPAVAEALPKADLRSGLNKRQLGLLAAYIALMFLFARMQSLASLPC